MKGGDKNSKKRDDRKNKRSNERPFKNQKCCHIVPKSISLNFTLDIVHHGKTTLTDNLMGGAGMLSEKVVGDVKKGMAMWFDQQERRRQLTIYGANVSMVHEFDEEDYLINLVDIHSINGR